MEYHTTRQQEGDFEDFEEGCQAFWDGQMFSECKSLSWQEGYKAAEESKLFEDY